ncbi:nucleotidyltransferase substrate binding protein [Thiospirochaeta perfilievii]|nr:nucleotidyltransferase substrate binding protein [Thiospirochaeta perfilievii]
MYYIYMEEDVRWKQRFSNFKRAFLLLRDALDGDISKLNQLEKEGVIQRFEYTFELAWKVLKDRMEYDGIIFDIISPKAVIRKAYESKYIDNLEVWFNMIGDRNLMSHTYDENKFEKIIMTTQSEYLTILDKLYMWLLEETL